MKRNQFLEAERLYFETKMTKTEIAETLGINRRTLHNWIHENEWDRLKNNAQHMPVYLAENCHFILANMMRHLMSDARAGQPATPAEVQAIQRLTTTAHRLRAGHTISETMQLTNQLLDFVCLHNPAMAIELSPLLRQFVTVRAKGDIYTYKPAQMTDDGTMPLPQDNPAEVQRDVADYMAEADAQRDWRDGEAPFTQPGQPVAPVPPPSPAPMGNGARAGADAASGHQIPLPSTATTRPGQPHTISKNQYPNLNRAERRKLARRAA
jgi:transposase-like protein